MNKGYITDSNLTHTRTRIKVTRARVRFILHQYLSIFKKSARSDIHVTANVTFIKYLLFTSLGSVASRSVSKKNTSNI